MSAPVPDATGDQGGALDLDAIEARATGSPQGPERRETILALVVEVRRLRATVERVDDLASQGVAEQQRDSEHVAANYLHIVRDVITHARP